MRMPQQREQEMLDHMATDPDLKGTAVCKLPTARWTVFTHPIVVAMNMGVCIPESDIKAFLNMGMPKSEHRQFNKDLHDLAFNPL